MDDSILEQNSDADIDSSQNSESDMELEQASTISVCWSKLPPLAVEKVYTFLNREDQSRMSQVCSNWHQEYDSTSLWRCFTFYLPETKYNSIDVHPEVILVRKFGHMFRDVQIIARKIRNSLLITIDMVLTIFLQELALNSKLKSISFINMNAYFRFLDEDDVFDVYQRIYHLLLAQNELQSVRFENTQFREREAAGIIQSIFLNSSGNLKQLLLQGFIKEISDDENSCAVIDVPLTFHAMIHLKLLAADYTRYFENVITSCYEYGSTSYPPGTKGDLEAIFLYCKSSKQVNYRRIQAAAWIYIRKLFPDLIMNVLFEVVGRTRNEFDVFIVPYMPIKTLEFKFNENERRRRELGSVLRHIVSCRINECLERLSVSGLTNSNNFATDLVNFLPVCPHLKILEICVEKQVESLDTIFQFWAENGRGSLEAVHLIISNVEIETASIYASLQDFYVPVLQVMGLEVVLTVNTLRRSLRIRL